MQSYTVSLRSGKDKSLLRKHPWVFSGAIKKIKNEAGREVNPPDGALVRVTDNRDQFLGLGHYQNGSIAVRILSFNDTEPNADFWHQKLANAIRHRDALGLISSQTTNVCRLVHAEGDGLPGLIIDWYNGTAVVQCHSVGMYQAREAIVQGLQAALGSRLEAVYDKSAETLPAKMRESLENGYLHGSGPGNTQVLEYGNTFRVDWVTGQKTGFFVDQRENRKLLAAYSAGKSVLNTFCYSGGFSVAALKAGAAHVHSVDSSARAIELTDQNVAINFPEGAPHQSTAEDTMKFLRADGGSYDIIVLDPPAYAKHQNVKHNAVQGYKRLNAQALEMIKPGGMLFTFSCSQVVDRSLFYHTITAAAISVGRNVRVLHHLSQPADHPVNIFHPEGEYLKGLVLLVD